MESERVPPSPRGYKHPTLAYLCVKKFLEEFDREEYTYEDFAEDCINATLQEDGGPMLEECERIFGQPKLKFAKQIMVSCVRASHVAHFLLHRIKK